MQTVEVTTSITNSNNAHVAPFLHEYERPQFLNLVESVKALMNEGEQIFYRQAFRWRDSENQPQSNCYEMFPAESIANAKGLKIVRKYGEHIFIGVAAQGCR